MNNDRNRILSDRIRNVILTEYKEMMSFDGSTISRFILIAVGIEFLGGCLDKQHMNATGRGEKRFNSAIRELFPKKYHHFTKPQSQPNLYVDFRCPALHQFTIGQGVFLCSAGEAQKDGLQHLTYNAAGALVLVAEDFYRDLVAAAELLTIRLNARQGL